MKVIDMPKISVSEVEGDIDYGKLTKEFGVEPIDSYLKKIVLASGRRGCQDEAFLTD